MRVRQDQRSVTSRRGLSLVSLLVALAVGGVVVTIAAQLMVQRRDIDDDQRLNETYHWLKTYYQDMVNDDGIVRATVKQGSPSLKRWVQSGGTDAPTNMTSAINVYNPAGRLLIPAPDGLYFDKAGKPANASRHAFRVRAFWKARPVGGFEIWTEVAPDASVGRALKTAKTRTLNTLRSECFSSATAWVDAPNYWGSADFDAKQAWRTADGFSTAGTTVPLDSEYTTLIHSCPADTILVSAAVDGGCGAKNAHVRRRLDIDDRTVECRQWTAYIEPPRAPNHQCYAKWVVIEGLPVLHVNGLRCEVRCCRFGS